MSNISSIYVIDNMGGFQIGDNVYIEGTIDPDCDTFCMQGDGCLYVDTIENCFFPYSDCGTLVQDLDCNLFQPDNGYKYLLVDPQFNIMTDFGDYEIGDRFRVVGSFVSVWDSLCMNQMGTIRVEALGDMGCNCIGIRGNIDGDILDAIDISDVVYLVNFLFFYDNPPINIEEADVNGSGGTVPVDITDLTYMVNYLFQGGPPPLDCP